MPHRQPAAILIELDKDHPAKQEALCLEYAEASRLIVMALCHHRHDCLALVMAGLVTAVIVACDPGGQLAEDVGRWGATLHVVRDVRTRIHRHMAQLVERMYRRNMSPEEIAAILEVDTREVRRTLYRAGIRPRSPTD